MRRRCGCCCGRCSRSCRGSRLSARRRTGVEAVELVQRLSPDVILLDVNVPRLSGLAAPGLIAPFRPGTRTILHSASLDGEAQREARELGMRVLDKMNFDQVVHKL